MKQMFSLSGIVIAIVLQAFIRVPALPAETLEDLQVLARKNREAIQQYETDLDIQDQEVRKAKGRFMPSMDISYTLNRLNHTGIAGEKSENDRIGVGISWTAFDGFKNYYDLESAKVMTDYSRYVLQSATRDIYLKVALKFLDVFRSLENLKVAEDEVRLYEDRLRQVRLKYDVGVLKKSDVLKIKVELDNALQQERRARADVSVSMNLLGMETGGELELQQLDFLRFNTLPSPGGYEELLPVLLKNRSELNALKVSLTAAGLNVKSAEASFYPRADISLSYNGANQGNYYFDSLSNADDEVRLQATLSMNLFDGMRKQAGVRQAVLQKEKIGYTIAELERELKVTLKNTLLQFEVAMDNLSVAESGTVEAEENLRVTDLSFNQGIATSSDVLDAILTLSRARFNRISARTDVFSADFALARLLETGDPHDE